ncbi:MAG: GGDEF domain-containing protein [Pseudomonadota bacterium]
MSFWELTIRKRTVLFSLLLALLFSALVVFIQIAMRANERSAEDMIAWAALFDLVNDGQVNIVEAGDFAGMMYQSFDDVDHVESEVVRLEHQFARVVENSASAGALGEKERFDRLVEHATGFYQELKKLPPIKRKMMENFVFYNGIMKPVHEIIQEQQLLHYKFVHQLTGKVRKGKRFFDGTEYGRRSFSPWMDEQYQTIDPVLLKMLKAIDPLHQKVHGTAVKADRLISEGRDSEAKELMDWFFDNMSLLDGRLADIEKYADEKYHSSLQDFLSQKENVMARHGEILGIIIEWKSYLKNSVLPETERKMHSSFARSRLLIVAAAVLVILMVLLICLYLTRKTAAAFQVTQESNEAIRISLEKQRQLIRNLEQEIEHRKNVEADLQAVNQELEDMAVTDGLTGLYNHRFMKQFLHMEHNRAIRHQHDLSVIMIDIDFFKKINDAYGHGCGDLVLLGIGEILQQRVRSTDMIARFDVDQAVVARYGGEEMAIILPETSLDGATGLAEDLRRMIESYTFHCEEVKMHITVSIGVAASTKEKDETWSALLGRADAALYRAKNGGRNRVEQFV